MTNPSKPCAKKKGKIKVSTKPGQLHEADKGRNSCRAGHVRPNSSLETPTVGGLNCFIGGHSLIVVTLRCGNGGSAMEPSACRCNGDRLVVTQRP